MSWWALPSTVTDVKGGRRFFNQSLLQREIPLDECKFIYSLPQLLQGAAQAVPRHCRETWGSIALRHSQFALISEIRPIYHSLLLIDIIKASKPTNLVTPFHPVADSSLSPQQWGFLSVFHTAFIPAALRWTSSPTSSTALISHPIWWQTKPQCGSYQGQNQLEEMGKHLLQDSLMLVGTNNNSNLFFPHRRTKCFFLFLGFPNWG